MKMNGDESEKRIEQSGVESSSIDRIREKMKVRKQGMEQKENEGRRIIG